jgi:hypothetical protein
MERDPLGAEGDLCGERDRLSENGSAGEKRIGWVGKESAGWERDRLVGRGLAAGKGIGWMGNGWLGGKGIS